MAEFSSLTLQKSHAEKAANTPRNGFVIQKKCGCGNAAPTGGTCSACAAKAAANSPVLKKPTVSTSATQPDGAIPQSLRERAEQTFGTALPDVNFYTGGTAQNYARQLEAKAFTAGNDVYFGSGFYRPDTPEGLRLIGHELTHVVQQRRGLAFSKLQGAGDTYEQEADRGGDAFAAGKRFSVSSPQGSIGRFPQRMGAAESAEVVGSESPSHDLEFLGEMMEQSEVESLFTDLQSLETPESKLYLIPESAVESFGDNRPHPSAPIPQAKLLDGASPQGRLPVIQRAIVAGCNVPTMTMGQIGVAAHRQIGGFCGVLHQAISPTTPCLGNGHPGFQIPGSTRPDMVKQWSQGPFVDEVGEIKPASWLNGRQVDAEAQLNRDIANYQRIIGPATTMWSYAFPTMPFVANPLQNIDVWPAVGGSASNGVYYYRCRNTRRRRAPRRVRIRVRLPVPVLLPRTVPRVVPQPNPQPVPSPRPAPRPTPRPVEPPSEPWRMPELPEMPDLRPAVKPVVAGAAAVGIGYLIYRGVRMIPSLAPPLWWTIPGNLAVP
ncbi:hypothetical protein D515_01436 [Grimontia indica]|uniref:DUF4157 domain-containing protein n=1 Tax=Grimontia indica TaxID=1056512 RepID=R1IQA0_9GAMM|nr:DUF4157 domain-containing protein [Grimontia indica]EOD79642.1 hypothetical protein D515_01436 [Grimontia indica]